MPKGTLRICNKGHRYYKSSDCPTCPVCEQERKPDHGFLSIVAAPARRALEKSNIHTLQQLSTYSEGDILGLHGMGPSAVRKLKNVLTASGLSFRK